MVFNRNKSWTRDGASSSGFSPFGRRDDRPYSTGKGKGKGRDRDREVVIIRDDKGRSEAPMDKMTLRLLNLYLEKKWNSQSGMLDLSNMNRTEDLEEINCNLNSSLFCDKLAHIIAKGEVWSKSLSSVNLSDNAITTLKHLAQAFAVHDVRVQNLCLSNNRIKELCEIDWLLDMKLREVLLDGNPIAGMGDRYHRYVVKKLRTIELLDTVSVKEWRRELLPSLPDPRDSCMADDTNATMVFQFCRLYCAAVDQGNFDALIDAYDNKCIFSHISEPTQRIYRTGPSKTYHNNLQIRSHNLMTMFAQKNPCRSVYSGRPTIIEFLRKELYGAIKTQHDVPTFKADAITMGDTVVATVHGSFSYTIDGDKQAYQRCFDRVFILRPNRAGTEWPARIANDSITIRTVQDHPIVMPPDTPTPGSVPMGMGAAVAAPLAATPLQLLLQQTNLTDVFGALLLKESGDSLDKALSLFKQNQALGLIPAEAFRR